VIAISGRRRGACCDMRDCRCFHLASDGFVSFGADHGRPHPAPQKLARRVYSLIPSVPIF